MHRESRGFKLCAQGERMGLMSWELCVSPVRVVHLVKECAVHASYLHVSIASDLHVQFVCVCFT